MVQRHGLCLTQCEDLSRSPWGIRQLTVIEHSLSRIRGGLLKSKLSNQKIPRGKPRWKFLKIISTPQPNFWIFSRSPAVPRSPLRCPWDFLFRIGSSPNHRFRAPIGSSSATIGPIAGPFAARLQAFGGSARDRVRGCVGFMVLSPCRPCNRV